MAPQSPAQGILMHHTYGDAMHYTVMCECMDPEHSHNVWVEADDTGVSVNSYVTHTTDFWSETVKNRYDIDNEVIQQAYWMFNYFINGLITKLKLTWQLWTKGHIKYQATLLMNEQTALNYAAVLQQAVRDVKIFNQSTLDQK